MTFQIRHTKPSLLGRKSFKILVVFFLALALVLFFNFFETTRSLVLETFSPMLEVGDSFHGGLGQAFKNFADKNQLIEENRLLSEEVTNNRFSLVDYEATSYENQKLREALKIRPAENFITAVVVARPPQVPLDSLFLDKGKTDALSVGDLVLTSERVLIGKIAEASRTKSVVSLNSFAGVTSYGFVMRTNEPLEIRGVGGGGMEAKVPIDFDIEVGDKLLTSDSFTHFVAVVGMIEEDRSSGFKDVLMSLPVDISKINMVFISPINVE